MFQNFCLLIPQFLAEFLKCHGQHCLNKIYILVVIWTVSSEGSNLSSSLPISSMRNINLEIWDSHSSPAEDSSVLGHDTVFWDMTLCSGTWHCVLGHDTMFWEMTLCSGKWHCVLGHDTVFWDMTLCSGTWHCVLGHDTVSLIEWFVTFQKFHLQVSSCVERLLELPAISWHHQIPEDLNPQY